MPVTGAYIVPHPPMIITDIGRGSEIQISETINSYHDISKRIREIDPDTIVIISPHSPVARKSFLIYGGDKAEGSFARFGAPNISFEESYDTELISGIKDACKELDIPCEVFGGEYELDHGIMVPLYFIRKYVTRAKIVRIAFTDLPLAVHYEFGRAIQKASESKNVVIVASGDCSHTLQEYGPYGRSEEGVAYEEKLVEVLSSGDVKGLLDFTPESLSGAAECGHRSFTILSGAIDGLDLKGRLLSHEDVTGVGYAVCSFDTEE